MIFIKYENKIVIEIDDKTINDYEIIYFKKYPKRKKRPIDTPYPPNLNKFILWKRPQQNSVKQAWKEFLEFLTNKYSNLEISECEIEFHFIFPDKRRRDIDNYLSTSTKLIIDGITKSDGNNIIIDDSYNNIKRISGSASYEKGIRKLEMIIKY